MRSWNWLKFTLQNPRRGCGQSSRQGPTSAAEPHLLPRPAKFLKLKLDRGYQAPGSGGDGGSGGDVGSGGASVDGPADRVLDGYGNVVPFWGDEPDDVPALHATRAGGEHAGQASFSEFSESFPTTSSTWPSSNNQIRCCVLQCQQALGKKLKRFTKWNCKNIGH